MVKRNYELPEKIVKLLEESSSRKGLGMQRIVAAGAWLLCKMNPVDRELALNAYADWLHDETTRPPPEVIVITGKIRTLFLEWTRGSVMSPHDAIEALILLGRTLDETKELGLRDALADWRERCEIGESEEQNVKPRITPDAISAVRDEEQSRGKSTKRQA